MSGASLQRSEWVFFFTLLALIVVSISVAKLSSYRNLELLQAWESEAQKNPVWVEISGHVRHPGRYKLESGKPLATAIRKAGPKPFADLSGIDQRRMLTEDFTLEIHPLEKIKVEVVGCVKEKVELELLPGSAISDLKGKIELTPDADRGFLRKKRKLKNGEVVAIPASSKQ